MIARDFDKTRLESLLRQFPVTAILGPRQCGKTTLARQIRYDHYFDLENPRDSARLSTPQLALEDLRGTIVIDEIQRMPDLFPLLRHLVDRNAGQKYLILGSASRDLIKQGSESLAGRIAYYILGGFRIDDIGRENMKKLWLRGGFPKSFLSKNNNESSLWRENYITTFLERDIPQLGITIPSNTIRRFWMMISHYNGQIVNYSEFARSFGITDMTVRKYIDILCGTFMLRLLQPWYVNIGKRLVKSPKIYFRDSGVFHTLLSISDDKELVTHNKLGASWEGFALEIVSRAIGLRDEEMFFWATHSGAELDLFWQHGGKNWGVEFKYMDAPAMTKSMHAAIDDLDLSHLWIIYPGSESYMIDKRITVMPVRSIGYTWEYSR